MEFVLKEIVEATQGELICGDPSIKCVGVSIDTRTIVKGELFVAIKGLHFDGHDFLGDAMGLGAGALLVRQGFDIPRGMAAIAVQDTVKALGGIAAWWRNKFSNPCIAITGSNGKSTTKEMIAASIRDLGPVLKTEGNFNNLIGLPLTIFRWNGSHKVSILEMGMNAAGEIRRLTQVARPSIGLITNITAAHLEKLHTVETVALAKGELFEAMDRHGVAVVNDEDVWVKKMAKVYEGERITFGMQNTSDVRFLHMETTGLDSMDLRVGVGGCEYEVRLPLPGTHNVMNALAAVAVGLGLGIDPEVSVTRLAEFCPMAMRFEQVQLANGVRVVNDSYNANPESMRAAFKTVGSARRAGRFVAALGDMLELGDASAELHRQIGEDAVRMGANRIYAMGDFAAELAAGAIDGGLAASTVFVCEGIEQMNRLVEEEIKSGDVLLVKGSRGMKMERLVEYLKTAKGTG